MKKSLFLILFFIVCFMGCRQEEDSLYTMGIFQVNDAPTLNAVREGFIKSLEDSGYRDGETVKLIIKNARGNIPELQKIAQDFVEQKMDMIVPFSTPSLQAALHATLKVPIVFSSVANPYLAGAGTSPHKHRSNVAGVSSRGPIKQSLEFIHRLFPEIRRVGTLWTPSELNSEYYLNLARESAVELGFEILSVPIANSTEIIHSAQVLINKKIDAIYQISDNTINANFEALGQVAEENAIPLFGGFLVSTRLGACAAMGWDFFEMGYKTGEIAVRVINGENPDSIPFQYMKEVKLHINLQSARKQNVRFPVEIRNLAEEILSNDKSE